MSAKTPCPVCRRPMYALLYSMVCDHCNPTNAVKAPDRSIKDHRGFVGTTRQVSDMVYRRFLVYKTRQDVIDAMGTKSNYDIFEVKTREPFDYSTDRANGR